MLKKFSISYGNKIEVVPILRETKASVWIAGWKGQEQRRSKNSGYEKYFDTWEDAHNHLLENAERSLTSAKERLETAEANLAKIRAMEP